MDPDTKRLTHDQLMQELAEASELARRASDSFGAVLADIPSGLPYPDSTNRIQNASRELRRARERLLQAQILLHNLVMDEILPYRNKSEKAK